MKFIKFAWNYLIPTFIQNFIKILVPSEVPYKSRKYVAIDALFYKKIKIGTGCSFVNWKKLEVLPGNIVIGNYTNLNGNHYFAIGGDNHIYIGNFCSIAYGVSFLPTSSHDYNALTNTPGILNIRNKPMIGKDIIIDHDVWIGKDSIILKGVHIGVGAVIGAGSVVTKNIPPYAIVAGNPAKIIKYRFSNMVIEEILKSKWREWPLEKIEKNYNLEFLNKNIKNIKDP